ncbi:glycosyltransferase [Rubinisphaera brasiliensis]|uniref:Glycosyl transferase group 1 n=1 Tax=Rubinisphaera brasiliensis (strain ATCC 49424 / DSM 5305 / JCM 21570 / IAM 15109 / NBRC 103401 / IFAM 1448) TaxID=756272 RepID=F0SNN2_RUBBR|nr:glycosyltransferase [Rubinisphaera brasiliensis]ADY58918.1 glycosyl transferase group 1 [Rubinisphaera brasiliensis DSM 5305]
MTEPKKIAHIVYNLNRGGIETWLKYIFETCDDPNFRFEVVTIDSQPAQYDKYFEELGIRIKRLYPATNPFIFLYRSLTLFRSERYDAIHSHLYVFNGIIMLLGWFCGTKHRISHFYPPNDRLPRSIARSVYTSCMWVLIRWFSTYVVACSHTTLDHVTKKIRSSVLPSTVVYCGIPLGQFEHARRPPSGEPELHPRQQTYTLGYVARFFPHKHHDFVLDLAEYYETNNPRLHFVLAGARGPCSDQIVARAKRSNNVSCHIDPEDVAPIYQQLDLFIFPSVHEGFGIVAVEAAACGVPVIASRLPAIMEAVSPKCRPLAFTPLALDECIASINLLLQHKELDATLRQEAPEWAQRFSVRRSWEDLRAVYVKLK